MLLHKPVHLWPPPLVAIARPAPIPKTYWSLTILGIPALIPPPPPGVCIWMHLVNDSGNSPSPGQPTLE